MKIGDLKKWPRLHQRALVCQTEYITSSGIGPVFGQGADSRSIGDAFVWEDTLEGHVFWSLILQRNIQAAKKLQPHLFIDTRGHRHSENEEVKQYLADRGFPVEGIPQITDLPTVDGENTDMYGNPVEYTVLKKPINFNRKYRVVVGDGLVKTQYEYIQIPIMDKVLDTFNELGEEGWKLVVKEGPVYTFLRNKRGS